MEKNEKIKKILNFSYGFLGMLILFFLITGKYLFQSEGPIIIFVVMFPFAFLGLILWLCFRKKHKMISIGLLLGGMTPFVIVYVMTGGCGLLPGF